MADKFINMVQAGKIFIFSKSTCPFCVQAKQILDQHQIQFEALEVNQTSDYTAAIKNQVDQFAGIATYPKVFIGKKCIGGCSELRSVVNNGSLFGMLDQESISYKK